MGPIVANEDSTQLLDRIAIGHRIATLRIACNFSHEVAAGLAGRSRRWIYDAEKGKASLDVDAINGLAIAFGVSPAVVQCLEPLPARFTADRVDMRRRDFICGALGFAGLGALSTANPLATSAWSTERPVLPDQVSSIRSWTRSLPELDNRFGGGFASTLAAAHLHDRVLPLVRAGRFNDTVRRDLMCAAAELAHLTGWMSYDVGQPDLGRRYFDQAIELAVGAGDQHFAAEILAGLSHQLLQLREFAEAVVQARGARQMAEAFGSPLLLSEAHVMEARAYARLEDRPRSAEHVHAAERAFSRSDPATEPEWLRYFDGAYLAAASAHCFRDVGRWREAEKQAKRSLQMNPAYVRGRAFNTALLATTYVETNMDEALRVGREAVDLVAGLESDHARQYITDLCARLLLAKKIRVFALSTNTFTKF